MKIFVQRTWYKNYIYTIVLQLFVQPNAGGVGGFFGKPTISMLKVEDNFFVQKLYI